MSSFMQEIQDNYKTWREGSNKEIDSWFLMESPGPVLGLLCAYLVFVLKVGPSMMRKREPMKLQKTLVAYNGFQVLFSIFLVSQSLRVELPIKSLFTSSCNRHSSSNFKPFAEGTWWYFIAKVTEFADTIFFVLRKKQSQVTFLHVYHHSIVMLFSWCFLKYFPGEQGAIIGTLNSGVHVIMYLYYMISAMGPKYQKYLWWKKYMTMIQLAQFCLMISYMTLLAVNNCGYQKSVTYFFLINSFIFFVLFMDFYKKSYKKSIKASGIAKEAHRPPPNEGYIDDTQAYLQITEDVILLDKSEKLHKTE